MFFIAAVLLGASISIKAKVPSETNVSNERSVNYPVAETFACPVSYAPSSCGTFSGYLQEFDICGNTVDAGIGIEYDYDLDCSKFPPCVVDLGSREVTGAHVVVDTEYATATAVPGSGGLEYTAEVDFNGDTYYFTFEISDLETGCIIASTISLFP